MKKVEIGQRTNIKWNEQTIANMPSQCICLKSVSKYKGNNVRKKRWPNRMNSEPTRIENDRQWWTFSETRHDSPCSFPIQRAVFTKIELPLKIACLYATIPWTEFYIRPKKHSKRQSLAKFPYTKPEYIVPTKTLVERGRPVGFQTLANWHPLAIAHRILKNQVYFQGATFGSLYDTIHTKHWKHGSKDGRLYQSI